LGDYRSSLKRFVFNLVDAVAVLSEPFSVPEKSKNEELQAIRAELVRVEDSRRVQILQFILSPFRPRKQEGV